MAFDAAPQVEFQLTVFLSPAEARRLGIEGAPKVRKRTTRKSAPRAGAVSQCTSCGERFTTDAGEDAHVASGHARFEYLSVSLA